MLPRFLSRRNAVLLLPFLFATIYILHTTSPTLDLDLDLASICSGDLRSLSPLHWTSSSTTLYDGPIPLVLDAEGAPHPIPVIVANARRRHRRILRDRTATPEDAAKAYRQRRGRHPPPGFDAWARHALDHDAILVESFWDRIYDDTAPFWALDPKEIARRAQGWEHVIRVRKRKATFIGDVQGRVPWMQLWTDLVAEAAQHLPDVDVPINMMDEPRLLVPWDQVAKHVEEDLKSRTILDKDKTRSKYSGITKPSEGKFSTKWYNKRTPYWELLRLTCPPGSPAHSTLAINDYTTGPTLLPPDYSPAHAFAGYVVNHTMSSDPCTQPHLRGMHGSLILPISLNTSQDLLPIFGGSKLRANNEILLPGAMYLTNDRFYSGGDFHGPRWAKKKDGLVWRGDATGGQNTPENWAHFQRHRLVQMLNATVVSSLENATTPDAVAVAQTFALPPQDAYPSERRRNGTLGAWLSTFADAGFVHRLCEEKGCDHVDPYLPSVPGIDMAEQFRSKFLPDADGNSFSARFRGFLLSTSLPLKATLYAEWHDDRLVPWVHFVPLDNSFRDLYGVLEFFGDGDAETTAQQQHEQPPPGDELARQIAEEGKVWAEKVLRREDMVLYVWRLLLEWARICDVQRNSLAYVGDL